VITAEANETVGFAALLIDKKLYRPFWIWPSIYVITDENEARVSPSANRLADRDEAL
jgi:hypothetical protein